MTKSNENYYSPYSRGKDGRHASGVNRTGLATVLLKIRTGA